MQSLDPATLGGIPLLAYPHACAIVRTRDEERSVVAPFVLEGLRSGEQVYFIDGPERRDEVRGWLMDAGREAEVRGQLQLRDWSETYLRNGRFDVAKMLDLVDEVTTVSEAGGFPRCRVVGHMDWSTGDHPGVGDIIQYEARVNAVLARHGAPAVCVYPEELLSPRMLIDLLAVHPVVFLAGAAHESPFFVPPERFLETRRA